MPDPLISGRLKAFTQELQRGLRIAVLAVAVAVLVIPASFLRHVSTYDPLWPQLLAYLALLAIAVVEMVLVVRHRSWPAVRWPLLVAALGASVLSRIFLAPGETVTSADWVFGSLGWIGVILLLDSSLGYLIGFLAIHEACTLIKVMLTGPATNEELLNLAAASLGTIGYPLATGIAAFALRGVAVTAERASREAEEARTADAVEAEIHEHRQRRFADLYDTAGPLLRGIAEGALDLDAADVRHRCAVEAARMRRLFAETDSVPDPLVHELTQSADVATRKGVIVDFETRGAWPPVPVDVRRALTEPILTALAAALSEAKITVVGTPGLLSVNVVANCAVTVDVSSDHALVKVQSLREDDTTWVEAQWLISR
jgi:hypothetical protein